MGIRQHQWGVSHARDVVWSQVVGLDPERADRALFVIWHGYFDESEKDDWFVLAGYISTVSNWADFSAEWAKLARRYGRIDSKGRYYFHMSEQANRADAQEFLPSLLDTIHKGVLAGRVMALRPSDLEKAAKHLIVFQNNRAFPAKGDIVGNYFLFAFQNFIEDMSALALRKLSPFDQIDPVRDRIEMYFDERKEAKKIRDAWEHFKEIRKEQNIIRSEPRFEDDHEFLPLQAADFLAYWARKAIVERGGRERFAAEKSVFTFPHKPGKLVPYLIQVFTEDKIVGTLTGMQIDDLKIIDSRKIVTAKKK